MRWIAALLALALTLAAPSCGRVGELERPAMYEDTQ